MPLLAQTRGGRTKGVRKRLQLDRDTARSRIDLSTDSIDSNRAGGADHHLARIL
jgi:hypothetical protein